MVSVLHEAVHALRRGNARQFGILNENLKALLRTEPDVFSSIIADLVSRYEDNSGNVNPDEINEELTAKMLSYILDNKKAIKKLARENMNVFEKLADSVLAFTDANLERYSTLKYGEDSDYAIVASKMKKYRDEFLDSFIRGGEGYYRGDSVLNSTNFSLDKYTQNEIKNWSSSNIIIHNNRKQYDDFVNKALTDAKYNQKFNNLIRGLHNLFWLCHF